MMQQFKYGLRNASQILNRIRMNHLRKLTGSPAENEHSINQTFIEDQGDMSLSYAKLKQQEQQENISRAKQQNEEKQPFIAVQIKHKIEDHSPLSFCQKIILKNLQETFINYQNDLKILNENCKNYQESIQILAQKIKKLPQLEQSNYKLKEQNAQLKNQLQILVREYHQNLILLNSARLNEHQHFQKERGKAKLIFEHCRSDHKYLAFSQKWNEYLVNQTAIQNKIDEKIQKEKERGVSKFVSQQAMKIIPKQQQPPIIEQNRPKKKISQSQRASLLGDLKSFAKSFKFPQQ